jgi:hypothetical protein
MITREGEKQRHIIMLQTYGPVALFTYCCHGKHSQEWKYFVVALFELSLQTFGLPAKRKQSVPIVQNSTLIKRDHVIRALEVIFNRIFSIENILY